MAWWHSRPAVGQKNLQCRLWVESGHCNFHNGRCNFEAMDEPLIYSVGLGGDGDEVSAIQDVEKAFGVALDYSDASHWRTAGDVFASLLKSLPANAEQDPNLWDRFAEALSGQTGIDPTLISKGSPLLLPQSLVWARIEDAWGIIAWGLIALALAALALGHFADA